MLIALVIVLVLLLVASIVANFMLYNAATLQYNRAQVYEDWIAEFRDDVFKSYSEIKELDDKQIFVKDDEVGVVFQDLLGVVTKLNNRTQEVEEEQ